jgi:hypothetical protein
MAVEANGLNCAYKSSSRKGRPDEHLACRIPSSAKVQVLSPAPTTDSFDGLIFGWRESEPNMA